MTLGQNGTSGPQLGPTLSPIYLTAVHPAVSQDGARTWAEAFQKTWNQFAGPLGPANVQTWDGMPLGGRQE